MLRGSWVCGWWFTVCGLQFGFGVHGLRQMPPVVHANEWDSWDKWDLCGAIFANRKPRRGNRQLQTLNGESVSGPDANSGGPGRPDA
jgi:hypothetical protein